MNITSQKRLHEIYQACRSIVGYETWEKVITGLIFPPDPEQLIISLERTGEQGIPEFLPDLARLEWTIKEVEEITYKSLKDSEGNLVYNGSEEHVKQFVEEDEVPGWG